MSSIKYFSLEGPIHLQDFNLCKINLFKKILKIMNYCQVDVQDITNFIIEFILKNLLKKIYLYCGQQITHKIQW